MRKGDLEIAPTSGYLDGGGEVAEFAGCDALASENGNDPSSVEGFSVRGVRMLDFQEQRVIGAIFILSCFGGLIRLWGRASGNTSLPNHPSVAAVGLASGTKVSEGGFEPV